MFGVVPALVTPLDDRGNLLEDGLRAVVDHVIDGGVHGVFVLGSSGEIYGLDARQKARVVEVTVEHVAGRVPVYAGASEVTTRDCLRTVDMIGAVGGVSGISVLTPYFMTPTQDELVTHYEEIADASPLPVLLYTNPGRTQVDLRTETVLHLAQHENIVGVKDSSGSVPALDALVDGRPDGFVVVVGRDTLILEGLLRGADGAIASTANIAPALVVGVYEAYRAGDLERAARLQAALSPLRTAVDLATFPVVLKEGLRLAGVDAGVCFAPARALGLAARDQLRAVVGAAIAAPTTV